MSTQIQTFLTWIIGIILIITMLVFGMSAFSVNTKQMEMNNAVQLMITNSRDNDARVARGLYVINRPTFERYLAQSNFKNWYNQKGTSDVHLSYKFYVDEDDPNVKAFARVQPSARPVNGSYAKTTSVPVKAVKVAVIGKRNGKDTILNVVNYTINGQVNTRKDDISKVDPDKVVDTGKF